MAYCRCCILSCRIRIKVCVDVSDFLESELLLCVRELLAERLADSLPLSDADSLLLGLLEELGLADDDAELLAFTDKEAE